MNPIALAETYRRLRLSLVAEYPELALDNDALADTLDGIHGGPDAVVSLARRSKEDEAAAAGIQTLIDQYTSRKNRLIKRAEAERQAAFDLMQEMGLTKIERPEMTLNVQSGQRRVLVTDNHSLPDAYVEIVRQPNRAKIGEALKNGMDVPGATLANANQHLTVRIK